MRAGSRTVLTLVVTLLVTAAAGRAQEPFSFAVFGDLNGGDCQRNVRFHGLVALMAASPAELFFHTGDLIEGYGTTSCFAHDNGCSGSTASGSMAYQLAPILAKAPPPGLDTVFFPVIGNHDGNWGSGWYPDPCGDGFCDVVDPALLINHGAVLAVPGFYPHDLDHGDLCSLDQATSGHPADFYYSFSYANSYFIVLRQSEDYSGMLSCNGGHTGYDSCEEYCSDPTLYLVLAAQQRLLQCLPVRLAGQRAAGGGRLRPPFRPAARTAAHQQLEPPHDPRRRAAAGPARGA